MCLSVCVCSQVCAWSKVTLYWYCNDSLEDCEETCYVTRLQFCGYLKLESADFGVRTGRMWAHKLLLLTGVIHLLRHETAVSNTRGGVEAADETLLLCSRQWTTNGPVLTRTQSSLSTHSCKLFFGVLWLFFSKQWCFERAPPPHRVSAFPNGC